MINGKFIILGYGSIGKAVHSLLMRHFEVSQDKFLIIDQLPSPSIQSGSPYISCRLTRENFAQTLSQYISKDDFLINLSMGISSYDLISWCQDQSILYLDTAIEPWEDGHEVEGFIDGIPFEGSPEAALRNKILSLKNSGKERTATAVIGHGANPGLISHFVKKALVMLSENKASPQSQQEWAELAQELDVKCIHLSERDTQKASFSRKLGEFANTWSIPGFLEEAFLPSTISWGSHEAKLPLGNEYKLLSTRYLSFPGHAVNNKVHSWVPLTGAMEALLIPHTEILTLGDYFTLYNKGEISYKPTIFFAYHPSEATFSSIEEWKKMDYQQPQFLKVLEEEIYQGADELGAMLHGNPQGSFWYGSTLTIEQARGLCLNTNATSLQVAAGVVSGLTWALKNPTCGIIEAEDMDYQEVLNIASPFLGDMKGVWTDWRPSQGPALVSSIVAYEYETSWNFTDFLTHRSDKYKDEHNYEEDDHHLKNIHLGGVGVM